MTGRRLLVSGLLVLLAVPLGWLAFAWLTFPSDRTPEGAYYRIVKAVNNGRPEQFFAYLEDAAQHACFTIRDYRKKSRELVLSSFQEPDRTTLATKYAAEASAPDGADLFALHAKEQHWLDRLRRDLSGIASVATKGERATIETARGTRYSFRRRPNGIWGLTMFTAALVSEAEKAARDHGLIEKAAADYERAKASSAKRQDGQDRG